MTNTRFIGKPHTIENSLSPIHGFKVSGLIQHISSKTLSILPPHHQDSSFHFSDSCLCVKSRKQRHNFLKCNCGFYAYRTTEAAGIHQQHETNSDNNIVIEVALSGLVIIAEHGYRAERQRVARVIMGRCRQCFVKYAETFMASEGESILVSTGFNNLMAVCNSCLSSTKEEVSIVEVQEQAYYPDHDMVEFHVGLQASIAQRLYPEANTKIRK